MSAIFFSGDAQEKIALESKNRIARELGKAPHTEIAPLATFYAAEDYHQKYYLRSDRTLMREFSGYPGEAFVASRVAARLNGYVGGDGTRVELEAELPSFGLSQEGATHLRSLVRR
jgi:hypothetical protein